MLTKVERFTVKIRLCVGRGIGPLTIAPVAFTVLTIFSADLSTKKSREQFELSSYKRLIDIYSSTAKTVDALMKLELPSGVEVEIKVLN